MRLERIVDGNGEAHLVAPDNHDIFLRTHEPNAGCAEFGCLVHNPSTHALSNATLNWRTDRALMERICSHWVGHPDPDDIAYKRRVSGDEYADAEAVHGCDGCCA